MRQAFPTLTGPATTNFATTLRTPPVRALLDGKNLRGTPLAEVVGHMSDAADAVRHLSITILEEMDELLEQVFADAVASTSQRPEQLHQDKGERHACHYWRARGKLTLGLVLGCRWTNSIIVPTNVWPITRSHGQLTTIRGLTPRATLKSPQCINLLGFRSTLGRITAVMV